MARWIDARHCLISKLYVAWASSCLCVRPVLLSCLGRVSPRTPRALEAGTMHTGSSSNPAGENAERRAHQPAAAASLGCASVPA